MRHDWFLHFSNHRFAPDDWVLPADDLGFETQHAGNRYYRSDRVFVFAPMTFGDFGGHYHGVYGYAVQVIDDVAPDPEGEALDEEYAQHGLRLATLERERACQQFMTTKARVLCLLSIGDLLNGEGSGTPWDGAPADHHHAWRR